MTLPTTLLQTIQSPEDLRGLPETSLAGELRPETISAVAVTGGHLGALGVVVCVIGDGAMSAGSTMPEAGVPLEIGKGRIVREGNSVALLSLGTRLHECLRAAEAPRGLSATVADARFAKPLDVELVLRLAREHEVLVTVAP